MDRDTKLIELEAKLFAHRRLIMALLKRLAEQHQEPEKFWAELSETAIVQDHQEDPPSCNHYRLHHLRSK